MNNFTRMHNDYLDPDTHLWGPEEPEWWHQCELNSRAIFNAYANGGDTWGSVYRSIYRYTPCGPTIGILFDNADKIVWNDDLYKYKKDNIALQIFISSIVEGVDEGTHTHFVDLRSITHSRKARRYLAEEIEAVNKEAIYIWNATHGCEECARLWGNCSPDGEEIKGCDGATPCHPECKQCKGNGVMI